jgi:4-hydroxythreonine-4-phosphate dehydrogenase
MNYRFHITTGDLDGVGLEVTLKSLIAILKKSASCHFVIWIHKTQINRVKKFLDQNIELLSSSQFFDFINLESLKPSKFNFLIHPEKTPAHWFKLVSQICLNNGDSVITGPLSKTQIFKEGIDLIGHTDILKQITGSTNLKMAFVGQYFSMILFTGHIPVNEFKYDKIKFKAFLKQCLAFQKKFKTKKSQLLILGLNPHAGDNGLIGKDDEKILKDSRRVLKVSKLIPADSAFVDYKSFKNNPTFISMYHDQGLIPFKMAHGFTGFHFTLGLPFIRTSVDHGTAKDLFKKNCANSNSMTDAILGAIKLKKGDL